jgi:RNA polymerase sigma-70 factor (ECF subfamily)
MSNDNENKGQFLDLYERYSDELFRYCFFKTGNREQSLEMIQDVFMKFWSASQKGMHPENPKAFLYASVRNGVTDWYRKKKPVSLDEMDELGFEVAFDMGLSDIDRLEAERIIKRADKLEDKYREVIVLRFVNDLSIAEIAELVGEKENNVSVRLHRALEKLRIIYTNPS